MSATLLYRIAAVVLLLFAAGPVSSVLCFFLVPVVFSGAVVVCVVWAAWLLRNARVSKPSADR